MKNTVQSISSATAPVGLMSHAAGGLAATAAAKRCATDRLALAKGWRSRLLLGAWSCLAAGCVSAPSQDTTTQVHAVVTTPAPVVSARQNPLEPALKALLQDRQGPVAEREQELRRLDELPHPSPLEQLRLAQGLEWTSGDAGAPFHHEAVALLEALRHDPQAEALAPLVQWLQDQAQGWNRLRAQRDQLAQQLKESQARVDGLNNKIQELKAIERNLVSRPGSDAAERYPRH